MIDALVGAVRDLGVDGINVDIEALDPMLVPAYGAFVGDLLGAVEAKDPALTVSVATGGHALGAAMAVAAAAAGVDRIFLMGYDYRTGRSDPGATAPLDRSDGDTASLRSSLDLYAALGVPADRLLLGLPLYGVDWPVAGPVIGAPSTGRGEAWFPRAHVDLLTDPSIVPERDEVEQVDVYFSASDGTIGAPSIPPSPSDAASPSIPPSAPAVRRGVAAGRSNLARGLRRHAGDARPEARPRQRARACRGRVLGDRVHPRPAGLHGPDAVVPPGRPAAVAVARRAGRNHRRPLTSSRRRGSMTP